MPDNNIIRVNIKSAEEMAKLGGFFSAQFLQPLIEGGDKTANQPVVAMYGLSGSGKTTLLKGMCELFPQVVKEVSGLKSKKYYGTLSLTAETEMGKRLYRVKDFGCWTHSDGNPDRDMYRNCGMLLRSSPLFEPPSI